MSKTKHALDVVQDLRTLADSIEALANAVTDDTPVKPVSTASSPEAQTTPKVHPSPEAHPTPETQPVEPKLTLVELRAFVAERSTPENRPKIKAILNRFNVNKLTELDAEQYESVKREVAAL